MAILSNRDIERYVSDGAIGIDPYEINNVQGATIDFRLSNSFLIPIYHNEKGKAIIDLSEDFPHEERVSDTIIIPPRHFILGSTLEKLTLPNNLSARIDGKSKIGRKGLVVQNAGHIGPGFSGEITLELYNSAQMPISIHYGAPICQVEFHELSSHSNKGYRGRFQNQSGPRV